MARYDVSFHRPVTCGEILFSFVPFIEIEQVRTYVSRIPHVHPYRDFILARILLHVESLRWDRVTGPPLRLNEFNEFFSVDRSVIGDLVAHGISTDTILLSTN